LIPILYRSHRGDEQHTWIGSGERGVDELPPFTASDRQTIKMSREPIVEASKVRQSRMRRLRQSRPARMKNGSVLGMLHDDDRKNRCLDHG
jgi:hypothetical protein